MARFIAISEALERWAYAATALSPERARYGFDVDPMSNGMAAFPGWRRAQARDTARLEAVERFSLTAWWEGCLPATQRATEWPGVTAVVIGEDPASVTVVLHKRVAEGQHAYGHAAARTFSAACRKAAVELTRHERVVHGYRQKRTMGGIATADPTDLLECRSLYFASAAGHQAFLRRLEAPLSVQPPERRVAFDGPIPGPWTRYAECGGWCIIRFPPGI